MFNFTEEEMTGIISESEKLDALREKFRREMQLVDEYPDMEERYTLMMEAKDRVSEQSEVLARLVADFVRAHRGE
ncbi:MAG: hypothetical protein K6E83_10635 [Clostridium sp.]|nr:hypothetical protein [Clostridium sp.]